MELIPIRRALLSVSEKTGLVELARGLAKHRVVLLSTGGTAKALADAGLAVTDVADVTGWPEMLDGRVKTLHPKIHGGILHRRGVPDHLATVAAHDIPPIDLVVVNLYPFEATVAKPGTTREQAVEKIDVGGPTMVRAAAKNADHVGVLTDPAQYAGFLAEMQRHGGYVTRPLLRRLAAAAFARTAAYDRAIADFLAAAEPGERAAAVADDGPFPAEWRGAYRRVQVLRYGENPHQPAALYADPAFVGPSVVSAEKVHGKELSYNNLLDLDAALALVREFAEPAAAVLKHNNPCGCASAADLATAFREAYAGDPLSAFGGVLGFNRPVDAATAAALAEPGKFVEAIVAPDFLPDALHTLTTVPTWRANVRLLRTGDMADPRGERGRRLAARPIDGGLLLQAPDVGHDEVRADQCVTKRAPTDEELDALRFAWVAVKHVRSNAIVLARGRSLVGVGAGQMSRVDSVRIASEKAGDRSKGAVLASDAFFPFRDNVDLAARAGVTAIVQPGGSKRDAESVAACDEHGIAMLFTGVRHFRH